MFRITSLAFVIGCAVAGSACANPGKPLAGHASINPDGKLEVKNVRGKVQISVWDRNEVDVSGTLGEGSTFVIDGGPAAVSIRIDSSDNKSWWGFGSNGPREDTTLEIKVPKAISPHISVVSSDVDIKDLDGSREVNVETVSGDVRVSARTERLELHGVSGDFTFSGASTRGRLETVSGDITVDGAGGELAVESVSGDTHVTAGTLREFKAHSVSGDTSLTAAALAPHSRVKVESMSGDVRVLLPPDVSAALEANTFSGTIRSDFGKVDKEEYGPGAKLRTSIGSGDGEIHVETFSGDVNVHKR